MTSQSSTPELGSCDLRDYGLARARDLAFNAVQLLWRRRQSEGWKQIDIARALNRDTAWVSRKLRGPGNWTLRTFGELVEALNGEVEITVHALEDPIATRPNYHAYAGYELPEALLRSQQSAPTRKDYQDVDPVMHGLVHRHPEPIKKTPSGLETLLGGGS